MAAVMVQAHLGPMPHHTVVPGSRPQQSGPGLLVGVGLALGVAWIIQSGVWHADSLARVPFGALVLPALVWLAYRWGQQSLWPLANTDALTGLANFRAFTSALEREVARVSRSGGSFSVLAVDLDGLKRINDTLGHAAGNLAIERVAHALTACARGGDVAARVGGDEFALILPGADRLTATIVAERITRSLVDDEVAPWVRVSWGIATYPVDGMTSDELVRAADRLMYDDKARHVARRVARQARRDARTPRSLDIGGLR
jgi:diguanylate cyclase (GGDEF)-like protein